MNKEEDKKSSGKYISIKRIATGYMVSSYSDSGETSEVARNFGEAAKIAKRIREE